MKNETSPNDPAFPEADGVVGGLTKREYFAVLAMQGIVADHKTLLAISEPKLKADIETALVAVKFADALIAELNK